MTDRTACLFSIVFLACGLLVACPSEPSADADGDGYSALAGDCDDSSASINPGAVDIPYNGVDEDCSGGDLVDVDGDGWPGGTDGADCDDSLASTNPDAVETCNGLDDDCDDLVDADDPGVADADEWFIDVDGDGWGDPIGGLLSCTPVEERVTTVGDCDDEEPRRFPGNAEYCDGLDNDCDDALSADEADADGDGSSICAGFDCDDDDPGNFPANAESCDGRDNNCNEQVDEGFDVDDDGYLACDGDCDDGDESVRPGANEICNGLDDDCDTVVDQGLSPDDDGDGFTAIGACGGSGDDCDDADATAHPGAFDDCDGLDDDCDGTIEDEGLDSDGDGVTDCTDCDDADPSVAPGLAETCDGLDTDCVDGPGAPGEHDLDGDGVLACAGDCDDDDPNVFPGAAQQCDGKENDCMSALPADEQDDDGDGVMPCAGDCDDSDPARCPSCPEVCDGVFDNDCDGLGSAADDDVDGDGWTPCMGDCDDSSADRSPDLTELCSGWVDEDCDLDVDCADSTCMEEPECCVADDFEDDDIQADATLLLLGSTRQATSCPADPDWFVSEDQPYDTWVVFHICSSYGALDVQWLRSDGSVQDSATVLSGDCSTVSGRHWTGPFAAYLRVDSVDSSAYQVWLELPAEDPATQCANGIDDDQDGHVDCDDADCADLDRDGSEGLPCNTGPEWSVDCDDADPNIGDDENFENDPVSCNDGIDNDCDGDVDCVDGYCGDDPDCLSIGCRAGDQEASEPNDDAFNATVISLGQTVEGATCATSDTDDFYRLDGIPEGWDMRCTIAWLDGLGEQNLYGWVWDPTEDDGMSSGVFQLWSVSDPPPIQEDIDVISWKAGDWILQVVPNSLVNDEGSNLYSFSCFRTGGVATETDCSDGVDQDLDGAIDCDDVDCTGSELCPCEVTDSISCGVLSAYDVGTGTDDYYQYPCTSEGNLGPERIVSFVAPQTGTYTISSAVAAYGPSSDDLNVYILDAGSSCRYGACLDSGNADYLSPESMTVPLVAGDEILIVLDGHQGVTDFIEAWLQVTCPGGCVDGDLDGYTAESCGGTDCDDLDPTLNPGNIEVCDEVDDNCDPFDEPFLVQFRDLDGDGQGDPAQVNDWSCYPTAGYVVNDDDCDDSDPSRLLGGVEVCGNGVDDDCDVDVDEGCGPSTETDCVDGLDEDADGDTDCADADCASDPSCAPVETPELSLGGLSAPGVAIAGGPITVTFSEFNSGGAAAGAHTNRIRISGDSTYGPADTLLCDDAVSGLASGASSGRSKTCTLPNWLSPGTWFVVVRVDGAGAVAEGNEGDNDGAVAFVVDLANSSPSAAVISAPTGVDAGVPLAVPVLVGSDPDGDLVKVQCVSLGSNHPEPSPYDSGLGAGGRTVTPSFTWTSGGNKTIYCTSFDQNGAASAVVTDVVVVTALTLLPDLYPITIGPPPTANPGDSIEIDHLVENGGDGPAGPHWTRFRISADTTYDTTDPLLCTDSSSGLDAGSFENRTTVGCLVPGWLSNGTWYVVVAVDAFGDVAESSEANNQIAGAITVGVPDSDGDGLADSLELYLAQQFRPFLAIQTDDACPARHPAWAVAPSIYEADNIGIFYALSYEDDCGVFTWESSVDLAHLGDTEVVVVEVSPDPSGGYLPDWVFLSSHWGMPVTDQSDWYPASDFTVDSTLTSGWHPVVFPARDKHGNYPSPSSSPIYDHTGSPGTPEEVPVLPELNLGSPSQPLQDPRPDPNGGPGIEYYWTDIQFCGWHVASPLNSDRGDCTGLGNTYRVQLLAWLNQTL